MYKQGDILLIPIPFSDLSSNKKRPVLVLSNNDYNNKTEDIIVAAITSNLAEKDYIVMSKFGVVKNHILDGVRKKLYELILKG